MSTEIFDAPGICVTTVCGPASEGHDRMRWEVCVFASDVITTRLTRVEACCLALAILRSAIPGVAREGS